MENSRICECCGYDGDQGHRSFNYVHPTLALNVGDGDHIQVCQVCNSAALALSVSMIQRFSKEVRSEIDEIARADQEWQEGWQRRNKEIEVLKETLSQRIVDKVKKAMNNG